MPESVSGVGVCVCVFCVVQAVSGLLQVPESEISSAMCNRLITAGTDVMIKPETREKANQVLLMTQTHRFISRTEFAQAVRGWFSCSTYSVRMLCLRMLCLLHAYAYAIRIPSYASTYAVLSASAVCERILGGTLGRQGR